MIDKSATKSEKDDKDKPQAAIPLSVEQVDEVGGGYVGEGGLAPTPIPGRPVPL